MNKFSKRETTGILAALRVCQSGMFNDAFRGMRDHWHKLRPLSADEIDTLCEKINSGDAPAKRPKPAITARELLARFPWLDDPEDEDVSGADVVEALSDWYESVKP